MHLLSFVEMLCNHVVLVLCLVLPALLVFAFSVGCLISLVFCMSELTYVLVDVDDAVSGFGFCCGLRCPLTALDGGDAALVARFLWEKSVARHRQGGLLYCVHNSYTVRTRPWLSPSLGLALK